MPWTLSYALQNGQRFDSMLLTMEKEIPWLFRLAWRHMGQSSQIRASVLSKDVIPSMTIAHPPLFFAKFQPCIFVCGGGISLPYPISFRFYCLHFTLKMLYMFSVNLNQFYTKKICFLRFHIMNYRQKKGEITCLKWHYSRENTYRAPAP